MTIDSSAGPHALGYYYQVRYSLLHILQGKEELKIAIEKTDDVETIDAEGLREMLQLKHHMGKNTALTDSSKDLWKTLRAWSSNLYKGQFSLIDTSLLLITNAKAAPGSILSFLCPNDQRDPQEAKKRISEFLNKTKSQEIKDLAKLYTDYLTEQQREELVRAIYVLDLSYSITEIPEVVKPLFITAHKKHHDAIYESIEGWWLDQVIRHLSSKSVNFITRFEVQAKLSDINEHLKMEGLPSLYRDEPVPADIDIQQGERQFVRQLLIIGVNEKRIFHAIRDYYRAIWDRSYWLRTNLLFDRELETYHQRLVEKWDEYAAIQQDNFKKQSGKTIDDAADDECKLLGEDIYEHIRSLKIPVRHENPYEHITRGSYHILANDNPPKVGWHPQFRKML